MFCLVIQNPAPRADGAFRSSRRRCARPSPDSGPPALSPSVAGTFSCTMKFTVRDCDPDTGVPAEEGYDDEYVVSLPRTLTPTPLHHRVTSACTEHVASAIWQELRGFYSSRKITTEDHLDWCSSLRGVCHAQENWDLPLNDGLKQNSLFDVFIIGIIKRWNNYMIFMEINEFYLKYWVFSVIV